MPFQLFGTNRRTGMVVTKELIRRRGTRRVAAMVALFAGLLSFLREIFIATANLRIGPH